MNKKSNLKKNKKEAKVGTAKKLISNKKTNEREQAPLDILLYPHLAEKSMGMIDLQNKIIFMVDPRSDKKQIKQAVEKLFSVKVAGVSTEITTTGQKKAYIKLHKDYSAADIASRLGVM